MALTKTPDVYSLPPEEEAGPEVIHMTRHPKGKGMASERYLSLRGEDREGEEEEEEEDQEGQGNEERRLQGNEEHDEEEEEEGEGEEDGEEEGEYPPNAETRRIEEVRSLSLIF
jgi:hypothetical protein